MATPTTTRPHLASCCESMVFLFRRRRVAMRGRAQSALDDHERLLRRATQHTRRGIPGREAGAARESHGNPAGVMPLPDSPSSFIYASVHVLVTSSVEAKTPRRNAGSSRGVVTMTRDVWLKKHPYLQP